MTADRQFGGNRLRQERSFARELRVRRMPRFVKWFLVLGFVAVIAVGTWLLIARVLTPPPGEEGYSGSVQDISVAGFDIISGGNHRIFIHVKPPLIVNLTGAGGRYAMRVQIRLEVDSRAVADELNENPAKYHRMVDLMLSTLRSKSYAELAYGDGIERLKEELLAKLRPFVSRGKILRVLFHELYFAELLPYARVGS
jgi:flagellar basal body-associated protein FliL